MPNIYLPLPGITQAVSRPVITEIVRQLQEYTGIDPKTQIFYPGEANVMATPGSRIGEEDRSATFGVERIAFIEVAEDFERGAVNTTATGQQEHLSVFIDPKLGIALTPIYATTEVTITYKFRAQSKTEASRWRDDMRIKISQMRDIHLHDVTYHYSLPNAAIAVLEAAYDAREAVRPYGQSFEEYVTANSSTRLTTIGDLTAKEKRLAISETQTEIIGIFQYDAIPDKVEHDETSGTYSVSFDYKFTYEKPIEAHLHYPVMVHNQLLPEPLVRFQKTSKDLKRRNLAMSKSFNAMSIFTSDARINAAHDTDMLIRLPEYDDFLIPNAPPGTASVFLALVEVDPVDRRTLFNLRELGDIVIDPVILDFIEKSEYSYIPKLYGSIIQVQLYRNNSLTSMGSLTIDSDLNVKATADLDLRNQHRVRFSLVTDLTRLNKTAIDRIREYPAAMYKIIGSMNELLRNHSDFIDLGNQQVITIQEFNAIYGMLTGFGLNSNSDRGVGNYFGPGRNIDSWPYSSSPNADANVNRATTGVHISGQPELTGNVLTKPAGASRSIFGDLDGRIVEQYRNMQTTMKTVMTTGIVAIQQSQ